MRRQNDESGEKEKLVREGNDRLGSGGGREDSEGKGVLGELGVGDQGRADGRP